MRSRWVRRGNALTVLAGALVGIAAVVPTGIVGATNGFHAYSVAMQQGAGFTGVRATWRDFEPSLVRPILNVARCYNDADVNAAVWVVMSDHTQLEIGYTVEACGLPGRLVAYRYVAITDPSGNQDVVELDSRGHATDSLLQRFAPNGRTHTYDVRRTSDPRVWAFELDGHVVHRWRSATVQSGSLVESGIESYQPDARVRATFAALGQMHGGAWSPWRADATVCTTSRMSGLVARDGWNAREN